MGLAGVVVAGVSVGGPAQVRCRVSVGEDDGELRVRILFAAEPDTEGEVRHLIERPCPGR